MEYTPRLGLRKPASGDYMDINDLNANMDIIDGKPTVIETGGNSVLRFRKWSDGTYEMWGRGNNDNLNCNTPIHSSGLYKSANATVNFPIVIKTINVLLLTGGCNHERSSAGYGHRETEAYVYDETYTTLVYYYVTPMDEGSYSPTNTWAKNFNLYMRGTY